MNPSAQIRTYQKHALLIGVGQRQDDTAAMAVSADDAGYLKKALAGYCRFEEDKIDLLVNAEANKENIRGKFDSLAKTTKEAPADLVIIFFSGHGYTKDDKYYLVCRDTLNNSIEDTAIEGTEFVKWLKAVQCNKMLVLLDCCHAAGMTDIPFDKDLLFQEKNRVIITACEKKEFSYLSTPVSLFTFAVIETLRGKYLNGEKEVNVFGLAMNVRERVATLAKQIQKEQRPQLNLLTESATTNFKLIDYPKGEPHTVELFEEEIKVIKSYNGKAINTDVVSERDEDYRNQFIGVFNIQSYFGSGDLVMGNKGSSLSEVKDFLVDILEANRKGTIATAKEIREEFQHQNALSNNEKLPEKAEKGKPKEEEQTQNIPVKRKIEKKHNDIGFNNAKVKNFTITVNDDKDIKLSYSELKEDLGIPADESINDLLCGNTITYCYDTIRGSGENLKTNTRNNLSTLIGSYLYKILLNNKQGQQIINAINENEEKQEEEKSDLRLILNFDDNNKADNLSLWPWEYLYYTNEQNGSDDYFLYTKMKIHRVAAIQEKPTKAEAVEKLKVLIFFSPEKNDYDDEHINKIAGAFDELKNDYGDVFNESKKLKETGNFECTFLSAPKNDETEIRNTYSNFISTINNYKPNIIHFIGEAGINAKAEQLNFWRMESNKGVTESVMLDKGFYKEMKDAIERNPPLKLFILQSWNNTADVAYQAYKKIAGKLVEKGLPAVISVPSGFHINGTQSFSDYLKAIKEFYEILSEEHSLGDAIFKFREALKTAEKGCPIVYFRNLDSDNFCIQPAAPDMKQQQVFRGSNTS